MSLRLIFDPAAKLEFVEAIAWYETQRPGLGREFAVEAGRLLKRAPVHQPVRAQYHLADLLEDFARDHGRWEGEVASSGRNAAESRPRWTAPRNPHAIGCEASR